MKKLAFLCAIVFALMIAGTVFGLNQLFGQEEYTEYTPTGVAYISAEGSEKQWEEYDSYSWEVVPDSILVINRGSVLNLREHLMEYIVFATRGEYTVRAMKKKSLQKIIIIAASLDPSFSTAGMIKNPDLRLQAILSEIGHYSVVIVPIRHINIQE